MKRIRERDVEAYLVKRVAALGGVAEKFSSPARRNVPDRLVLWPTGPFVEPARTHFVECKAPGKKPTPAQARDHARRRAMGFTVAVVDSYEAVAAYLLETNT